MTNSKWGMGFARTAVCVAVAMATAVAVAATADTGLVRASGGGA